MHLGLSTREKPENRGATSRRTIACNKPRRIKPIDIMVFSYLKITMRRMARVRMI